MARYIDVDIAVKEAIEACNKLFRENGQILTSIDAVYIAEALDEIPTADVVEVVRCKKCAHANDDGTICRYGVGHNVTPNHFCGYGERREL